ncbi:hypothetical protein [Bosea sp. PAMC 26642]|uniref:hypothetical protein n=1 Tax=Bosea sp. (strain PAMC 26642) TaxID=1792307 RepID=UPI00076FEE51|nr:hypothetical protein [Bosea sp. PAMC 26642]AMJ62766.1 hypothetical protein AXW83_22920 [Bosea sp. PAMC 26642]
MKSGVVLAAALTLLAEVAASQPRPSTVERSCDANRRSVAANGAIVLGTGGFTYDRFVNDRSFCQLDESLDPAWVPSRDVPACFIGYRCKSGSILDD